MHVLSFNTHPRIICRIYSFTLALVVVETLAICTQLAVKSSKEIPKQCDITTITTHFAPLDAYHFVLYIHTDNISELQLPKSFGSGRNAFNSHLGTTAAQQKYLYSELYHDHIHPLYTLRRIPFHSIHIHGQHIRTIASKYLWWWSKLEMYEQYGQVLQLQQPNTQKVCNIATISTNFAPLDAHPFVIYISIDNISELQLHTSFGGRRNV